MTYRINEEDGPATLTDDVASVVRLVADTAERGGTMHLSDVWPVRYAYALCGARPPLGETHDGIMEASIVREHPGAFEASPLCTSCLRVFARVAW